MCVLGGQRQQDSTCHLLGTSVTLQYPSSSAPPSVARHLKGPHLCTWVHPPQTMGLQEEQIQSRCPPDHAQGQLHHKAWAWGGGGGGSRGALTHAFAQSAHSKEDCELFWSPLAVITAREYFCSVLEAMKLKDQLQNVPHLVRTSLLHRCCLFLSPNVTKGRGQRAELLPGPISEGIHLTPETYQPKPS